MKLLALTTKILPGAMNKSFMKFPFIIFNTHLTLILKHTLPKISAQIRLTKNFKYVKYSITNLGNPYSNGLYFPKVRTIIRFTNLYYYESSDR